MPLESKFQLEDKIYNFHVPETFRVQWASKEIEESYGPRISDLSRAFQNAELQTVFGGFREGCILNVDKHDIIKDHAFYEEVHDRGCRIIPLNYVPKSTSYTNEVQPLIHNTEYNVRVLVLHNRFNLASGPIRDFGRVLGYPKCCVEFFDEYWGRRGYRDLNPIQLTRTYGISGEYFHHMSSCNVLLKGMGIRAVPHLPCSFDCSATNLFSALFTRFIGPAAVSLLTELLSMEVEYSSYHGYAEVRTKLFKNIFNSIPFKDEVKYTLKQLLTIERKSNNGFTSKDAENRAHYELINFICSFMLNDNGGVLDMGCGDGSLLERIGAIFSNLELEGIEIDRGTYSKLAKGITGYNQDLNEFVPQKKYTLILIANQRLLEMDGRDRTVFLSMIRKYTKYLVVYDYTGNSIYYPSGFTNPNRKKGEFVNMAVFVPYDPTYGLPTTSTH